MTNQHPIESIMHTSMEQIKQMVDVNTIVGDPITAADGTVILPVSKVSVGFLSGGGEYSKGESIFKRSENTEYVDDIRHPLIGTAGAGICLSPTAFLVVGSGNVKVVPAQYDNTIDRLIEIIPRGIEEIKKLLGGKSNPADAAGTAGTETGNEKTLG